MISFINEPRGVFGVEPICRLLPITRQPPTRTSPSAGMWTACRFATWQSFVYVAFLMDASLAASSADVQAGPPMRASFSMPSTSPCMISSPSIVAGWFIIPTVRR